MEVAVIATAIPKTSAPATNAHTYIGDIDRTMGKRSVEKGRNMI